MHPTQIIKFGTVPKNPTSFIPQNSTINHSMINCEYQKSNFNNNDGSTVYQTPLRSCSQATNVVSKFNSNREINSMNENISSMNLSTGGDGKNECMRGENKLYDRGKYRSVDLQTAKSRSGNKDMTSEHHNSTPRAYDDTPTSSHSDDAVVTSYKGKSYADAVKNKNKITIKGILKNITNKTNKSKIKKKYTS